jgi:fructose-1-phosphate kinase PfkB-like protein
MLARRQGQSWGDALRLGVAAAAAVVMNEGTAVCTAAQVHEMLPQVQFQPLLQA